MYYDVLGWRPSGHLKVHQFGEASHPPPDLLATSTTLHDLEPCSTQVGLDALNEEKMEFAEYIFQA